MKKMARLLLISAVLATSGLTAKIATENYKAGATNDERIHKAYELAKKPNKAAVLEAIADATNEESDERIHDAVVIESEDTSKTPKIVRVTTSAGVSPIASVMDKKPINKDEEFIGNIVHPVNIPDCNIPIQELKHELKDIFPEFEDVAEEIPLLYKITLPEITSDGDHYDAYGMSCYLFDLGGPKTSDGSKVNGISYISWGDSRICIGKYKIEGKSYSSGNLQRWYPADNNSNIIKFDPVSRTLDYSALLPQKDSSEPIPGFYVSDIPTYKEVYDVLVGVETGKYPLLTGI